MRLLDDGLAGRLSAAISAGSHVRLGAQYFEVTEPPAMVEQVSWQALRHWSGARAWQVRFLTPACFRRGNRTSPWPAPETVARGLADRWRRLHPDTAPADARAGSWNGVGQRHRGPQRGLGPDQERAPERRLAPG